MLNAFSASLKCLVQIAVLLPFCLAVGTISEIELAGSFEPDIFAL